MSQVLFAKDICKSFPGVQALDKVSIEFNSAEIHGLVGMNGSGKSTLVKIIGGIYRPDSGEILVNDEVKEIRGSSEARKLGISIIYQELSLVPCLTVAENIFLGHLVKNKFSKLINWNELRGKAQQLLNDLNVNIDPDNYVEDLDIAQQQMVEVAKALSFSAKLLIMDEPSSALTQVEMEDLFCLIHSLKEKGVTVIYISHKLEEVFEIADRVSILKDGRLVCTDKITNLTLSRLIKMMTGRERGNLYPEHHRENEKKKELLSIKGLNIGRLKDVNIKIKSYEIVGIYGLLGSGQKELVEAIFGINNEGLSIGSYHINGKSVKINSPFQAINSGITLIPDDRKKDGLMLKLNIKQNITITFLDRLTNWFGLINTKREKHLCLDLIDKFNIKVPSLNTRVENLSGGNQQKITIVKWVNKSSKIFICYEPTKGIDVESKSQIYNLLEKMCQSGAGILIISSEISEILGMCDRIALMTKGKIIGPVASNKVSEESLLAMGTELELKQK
jgi:ABC-type sugar transport system ATPase subunit